MLNDSERTVGSHSTRPSPEGGYDYERLIMKYSGTSFGIGQTVLITITEMSSLISQVVLHSDKSYFSDSQVSLLESVLIREVPLY